VDAVGEVLGVVRGLGVVAAFGQLLRDHPR